VNPQAPGARGPRIALVAGEASGDLLGAGLLRELRGRFPDAQFAGIGGPGMRAEGLDAWHDCDELAVMGLAEVLRHLPRLLRLRAALVRRLLDWRPDVFVGIDAPDFNLAVERRLKAAGHRTVHYVSPSVWAWRARRAARMGESADRVLCLFPMEPPIYARHGVDARFVGHPLADRFVLEPDRTAARAPLGLDPGATVLAVLPGSRLGEIRRLAEAFLRAAMLVAQRRPGLQVVVPAANAACRAALEAHVTALGCASLVRILDGDAATAMIAADAVLVASGTATLEALLAKRPMVVGYRIAPLTHALVKGLGMLKVDRYSLPNALARSLLDIDTLVPELMQHDCTPERLAAAVMEWLDHPERVAALMPRYRSIHERLRCGADAQAALAVAELVPAGERPGAYAIPGAA
jgi:lipid-A-disaccharide synthase